MMGVFMLNKNGLKRSFFSLRRPVARVGGSAVSIQEFIEDRFVFKNR